MPVSRESRQERTWKDWWGVDNGPNMGKQYLRGLSDSEHRWTFARRLFEDEKDIVTGYDQVITSEKEQSIYYRCGPDVTITNPFYESILILADFEEDVVLQVDYDEPFEKDSDFDQWYVIGPRQTLKVPGRTWEHILVPFVVSLNATMSEIPADTLFSLEGEWWGERVEERTFQEALDFYPGWKSYFNETALKLANLDEWNPLMDFWGTDTVLVDPSTGAVTESGYDDYFSEYDFIPKGLQPPPPDPPTEETDYSMWIVGGILVFIIIIVFYFTRKKGD